MLTQLVRPSSVRPLLAGVLLLLVLSTVYSHVTAKKARDVRGRAASVLRQQQRNQGPPPGGHERAAAQAAAAVFAACICCAAAALRPRTAPTAGGGRLKEAAESPALTGAEMTVYLRRDGHGRIGVVHIGTLIEAVQPGGAAHAAGVRPGMFITAVGEKRVATHDEVASAVASCGRCVELSILVPGGIAAAAAVRGLGPGALAARADPAALQHQRQLRRVAEDELRERTSEAQRERTARQALQSAAAADRARAAALEEKRLADEARDRVLQAEALMWMRIGERPDSALARAQGRWRVAHSGRVLTVQGLRVQYDGSAAHRELREVPPDGIELSGRAVVALRGGRLRWDDGVEWVRCEDGDAARSPRPPKRQQQQQQGAPAPPAAAPAGRSSSPQPPPGSPPAAAAPAGSPRSAGAASPRAESAPRSPDSPGAAAGAGEAAGQAAAGSPVDTVEGRTGSPPGSPAGPSPWSQRLWVWGVRDVEGEYGLLPTEECNGLPVWGCGERRLFADDTGMWVLAPNLKAKAKGDGSAWTPHNGLSPERCAQPWWNGARVSARNPADAAAGADGESGGFAGWAKAELQQGLGGSKFARMLIDSSTAP
eukprot:TRINITY_DN12495_c0_g1_i2.p1 TRINITY_DN12495_c0_g1~~TRINITY_DN12495_c0_g1_i2.p1  ORF type:complete len:599 (+),score=182.56 TRINITY_DN12495_c0_g1_i2:98-1894(+)